MKKRGPILGIDPGLDGGLGILTPDGQVVAQGRMPVLPGERREIDLLSLVEILRFWRPEFAVLELVHAMPKQGVRSMFSFGRSTGQVEGVLVALGIPFERVTPQRWKGAVLNGTARDKSAAIAYVRRRWPDAELMGSARCRVPHDGIAEALCLAEFGRRLLAAAASK